MTTSAGASLIAWWGDAPPAARRALLAASLGWLLDAFDVMLYALVLVSLMTDLGFDRATGGLLGSLTLAASAAGGILFGLIADRYGRARALIGSILIYSVFTAACGLAQNALQLAVFRVLLGLGMGGEWTSGAALVSETWPAEHRGKALGLMQSAWAVGYAVAAVVTAVVLPRWGWRAVFFVGVAPALFTLWVRRTVEEPQIWLNARTSIRDPHGRLGGIFREGLGPLTAAVTLMNAFTLFAWWGFNLWVPAYLSLPDLEGGVGLSTSVMSAFMVTMQIGMWFGYVSFGFVSDRFGRRRTYVVYLIVAAALLGAYGLARDPGLLLLMGPFVAFFGSGYFSGFGAVTAEIYPTRIRATAQGFTYNLGRIVSAVAPFVVGSLAQTHGFATAFAWVATAFVCAALMWIWIPETRGRRLDLPLASVS